MSLPLDHIVHLSAPGTLHATIEKFERLGFTVLPGGRHADGLTENALIVLADGVYIELLQFTNPPSHYTPGTIEYANRTNHWWARMKEGGWIDFSLGDTTSEGDISVADSINARSRAENTSVSYDQGIEGGRVKPDGDVIRWLVTFPSSKHLRGGIPFFCKDLTPRERRVPLQNTSKGRIAALALVTLNETFSERIAEISVALGSKPEQKGEGGRDAVWMLDSPDSLRAIELHLIAAKDEESETWARSIGGIGVWEVTLQAGDGDGAPTEPVEAKSGVGLIKWIT